jgi:hypothetical protein
MVSHHLCHVLILSDVLWDIKAFYCYAHVVLTQSSLNLPYSASSSTYARLLVEHTSYCWLSYHIWDMNLPESVLQKFMKRLPGLYLVLYKDRLFLADPNGFSFDV